MEEIGVRIKALRLKAGLRVTDLSKIGVSRSMLFLYEKGRVCPSVAKLVSIADLFDVSLDYLVGRSQCKYRSDEVLLLSEKTLKRINKRL